MTVAATVAPPTTARPRAGRGLVPLSATLLLGAIAALMETTIVSIALDALRDAFGTSVGRIQWVTTSYLLAMTAVIPVVGWTVNRWGARRMWVSSLSVFLVGSLLCGLAWSVESLIAFRVLKGLGGGMILPLTQLVLARAAGPERLGRTMGLVGLVGQIAPVTGPILGGLLIDGWGWRWVFLVNVPLCLASLVMATGWFPPDDDRRPAPLDLPGLVLLPTAAVALIYALSTVSATPGPATWLSLVAGLSLAAAFILRSVRPGRRALIDLRLFARRSFAAPAGLMFLMGVTTWGPMFLLPLYYQQFRAIGALDAGLMLAPQSVGLALAMPVAGRLADRFAPRPLALLGMAVAAVATVPFALATEHTGDLLLGAALLVRGIGFGIGSLPISVAVYKSVRPAAVPDATSASNVLQRIGAATGTALMAIVLQSSVGDGTTPSGDGFHHALVWMLVLTLVSLVASGCLPPGNGRDRPASSR